MKVVVLGNQARAMSNFWTVLLRRMIGAGYEVVCLVPTPEQGDDPSWEVLLAGLGARVAHYPLDRKGLNLARDVRTLWALATFFRRERPDTLFSSTVKPVIYGALASAAAGFPSREHRHVMITGLGYLFEGDSPVKRLLMHAARLLYRAALSCCTTVFFQNHDDRALFEKLSILPCSISVHMCKGTGVDVRYFSKQPLPEGPPVFLFVGRLLEAKGLRDLARAAALVRAEYPEVEFRLLGPPEKGPGAISLEEVRKWEAQGIMRYLGETRDTRPFLAEAHVVLLPSWREGTPCSLLEAMSTGRAVIAADAPGSREVVRDGVNGFLVPVKNPEALAEAVKRFVHEPRLMFCMGEAGRSIAEKEFPADRIAEALMRDMGLHG